MDHQRPVVLCVDDDGDILDGLCTFLEAKGFQVVTARDADEAVAAWEQQRPDFIVLDLMMEEADTGFQIARRLQTLGNQAPVVLLSSVGEACSQNVEPGQFGVVTFLQKPFRQDELLAVVNSSLGLA